MSETKANDADRSTELNDWLRLSLVSGVGPRILKQLLDHFGTPQAVLDAPPSSLREVPGVGPKLCRAIADAREQVDVDDELQVCHENDIQILTTQDDSYPRLLRDITTHRQHCLPAATCNPRTPSRSPLSALGMRRAMGLRKRKNFRPAWLAQALRSSAVWLEASTPPLTVPPWRPAAGRLRCWAVASSICTRRKTSRWRQRSSSKAHC